MAQYCPRQIRQLLTGEPIERQIQRIHPGLHSSNVCSNSSYSRLTEDSWQEQLWTTVEHWLDRTSGSLS
jgi:hypothetical protein